MRDAASPETPETPVPRRKPGPQTRAARNDRALIEAAREVFAVQGFGAPVAAIAERAGVGMGSLYRRYRTKEELFQHLCEDSMDQIAAAAEASAAIDEPWQALVAFIQRCVDFGLGTLAPLAGTIRPTPAMRRSSERAQELAEALIARARTAGALRGDVTTMDIFLFIGQFGMRHPAAPGAQDNTARQRVLAIAIDGLRPGPTTPLPGTAHSPEHYQALWRTHTTAPAGNDHSPAGEGRG
ncbi:TetR/AcrR family transcriptional regulator [Streptomyces triticirhizae]|uniref:TetR/AcrR family transcriptional regulator n=1 Tax=Streptomyces triticirhizae TaxID=2483353 RepID=A0A3M2LLM9_9ACTN|nr:TetR/AcrR family transcriptional regulator [Streptomyces triticirhizae]RMI36985.1 TetR/AcrR family transcriptional regulator [Streptomyces triticirhizae]